MNRVYPDTFLAEFSEGQLQIGLSLSLRHDVGSNIFRSGQIGWVFLLAMTCGAMGALYNSAVFKVNKAYRQRISKGRPWFPIFDAVATAAVCFSAYFWSPLIFDCRPCPITSGAHRMLSEVIAGTSSDEFATSSEISSDTSSGVHRLLATNSSGSGSASGNGGGSCMYTGHEALVQHVCKEGYFSELATLLLGGQERMTTHLLSQRVWSNPAGGTEVLFSTPVLAFMLALYFVLATLTFGIRVPAGNFVSCLPQPEVDVPLPLPPQPTCRLRTYKPCSFALMFPCNLCRCLVSSSGQQLGVCMESCW